MKYLLVLFLFSDIYASFYKETVINHALPISVLDPARRPEIERLVTNLRFCGNAEPRPSKDVFIHHQSIQNARVFPTNHLTALAWMLFPISQQPIINPNNVRLSDPLGKLTPRKLGKLIAVMARFANPYYNSFSPADDLLDIFSIFASDNAVELLKKYSPDHNPELQEFYRYSLLEALNKYVGINYSMADLDNEEFNASAEKKADIIANPHRLLAFVLSNTASHLLEIPGTEILRRDDETWFTEAELDLELQELPKDVKHRTKYKTLGYKARDDYQIHAAVDMLYKAAQNSSNEVLALLAYYAWRKYPEKINDVVWASGSVNQIQYSKLMEVLSNPYSKADYQCLLAAFKAAENVDDFFENLTQPQQNLLLYGGARYDALLMQDYGNVRVEHAGKNLNFANCAEMSLFNLTYLAQLVEDDQGTSLIRSANGLVESPLKSFWQNLADEDLSTTATRNAWTQMIVRKPGVIYRKGGCKRESWQEFSNSNWAELNPGMLNQMRALFYLLGKPDEVLNLNYADSAEETVAAAAFKLSRLLSGLGIEDTSQDDSLPFCLNIGKIENKSAAKDWFGELSIERNGAGIATWHFQTNHSYLNVSSKQQVFDISLNTCNPLIIGQMVVVQPDFSIPYSHEQHLNSQQIYWAHLDKLKENDKAFDSFFKQANLANERLRRELGIWLVGCSKQNIRCSHTFYDHTAQETKTITRADRTANAENQMLVPYSEKLLWGMCPIDEGGELHFLNDSTLKILKHPKMQRLISFVDAQINSTDFFDQYSQSCLAYGKRKVRLNEINPEFLVPENRIGTLYLNVWQENIPSAEIDCWMGKPMPVDETLKILEALPSKLNCLESFCPQFSKNCSCADITKIMAFLPKTIRYTSLFSPVSPEQFLAFVSSLPATCEISMLNTAYGWGIGNPAQQNVGYAAVPNTFEECVFNLLEPLAKAGKAFQPPFIDFGDHHSFDLEPIYERLRVIAATPFAGLDDEELKRAI